MSTFKCIPYPRANSMHTQDHRSSETLGRSNPYPLIRKTGHWSMENRSPSPHLLTLVRGLQPSNLTPGPGHVPHHEFPETRQVQPKPRVLHGQESSRRTLSDFYPQKQNSGLCRPDFSDSQGSAHEDLGGPSTQASNLDFSPYFQIRLNMQL